MRACPPFFRSVTISAQLIHLIGYYGLWLFLLTIALPALAKPEVVGHVSFVRGSNAAQQPGAEPRFLGKDTEIYQGDNIQTTERSFVIIKFNDDSEITVRPKSNLSIDHYDNHSPSKAAHLALHHGAIAATTGDINKANPGNFQIKTPAATIKPKSRNAEFTVELCDQACEEKGKAAAANQVRTEQSIVARVVEIKGEVSARNTNQKPALKRPLSLKGPVYNSDTVITGKDSHALLVFPDGEKITLQDDTELDIVQYLYKVSGKNDQVSLRLVVGGLRALTGAIGKNNPGAVTVRTPVATIGIRGTGTDSFTDGTSLNHSTWQGLSFLSNEAGEFEVPAGVSSFTSSPNAMPMIAPTPENAPQPPAPRPDSNTDDAEKLFEADSPVSGDVTVTAIKGDLGIETQDGKVTETVNEGEITSTDSKGNTKTLDSAPAQAC